MKKIFILCICIAYGLNAKAQSLKESDFTFDDKGRPAIDRIFKTADGSLSMIYYSNATVSFYNNQKYTKAFVVHNIAEPLSMMIEREGQAKDILYYSNENASYRDKTTGAEYILDKKSIRSIEQSQ